MHIEIYVVENTEGAEVATFGPYGYETQGAAHKAAQASAAGYKGTVIAYTFAFDDSELLDDYRELPEEGVSS